MSADATSAEGRAQPSRERLADLARTLAAAGSFFGPMLLASLRRSRRGALPTTTTAEGLAATQEACRELLARLAVRLEVTGEDRVPESGGVVFMWNQASHLDHLVLPPAIPRPFHSIYNNALRATPFYGEYLRTSGHFWVDKNDKAQWRAQLGGVAARVRDGACVIVSPEGTRSWDGRLLPMKRGAFLLARHSERPIVCVTVIGARDCLPRGSVAVRPGTVRVVLSTPIAASSDDLEQRVVETFEAALAGRRS